MSEKNSLIDFVIVLLIGIIIGAGTIFFHQRNAINAVRAESETFKREQQRIAESYRQSVERTSATITGLQFIRDSNERTYSELGDVFEQVRKQELVLETGSDGSRNYSVTFSSR
jgi:hypothetical protein